MIDLLNRAALAVLDVLLGWALALPSDIALLALAFLSAAVLAAVRPFTTNQDLLRRCAADRRRLRTLVRDARRRDDEKAVARHRALLASVSTRVLRAEALPFLAALLPIAALAAWGFQRLEFRAPREGRPFTITVAFPPSAAGSVAHIAPEDGLEAGGGWIREITADGDRAAAEWTLEGRARPEPYVLRIRRGARTWEHEITIGSAFPPDPVVPRDDGILAIETGMEEVKLFTVVPGIRALSIPGWLVGYLLLAIPLAFLARRAFRIA